MASLDSLANADELSVAIAGGGLAGLALARALQQQGIKKVQVFELDPSVESRPQGYSLTIQAPGRSALKSLGLWDVVYKSSSPGGGGQHILAADGEILSQAVPQKVSDAGPEKVRHNRFIPRQRLRQILLEALAPGTVSWGCYVVGYADTGSGVDFTLSTGERSKAAVLVGSEGVRSYVRAQKLGDPLRFLGVAMINGITSGPGHCLSKAGSIQVLDGRARLFCKPFQGDRAMWQLTFPAEQSEAEAFHNCEKPELHARALLETEYWASEFRKLLEETEPSSMRGGALFDRDPLLCAKHADRCNVAIIGDAAHPMSPFKGQGANQALCDAIFLARTLSTVGSRKEVSDALKDFHTGMATRVTPYVFGSRRRVALDHTPAALQLRQV